MTTIHMMTGTANGVTTTKCGREVSRKKPGDHQTTGWYDDVTCPECLPLTAGRT